MLRVVTVNLNGIRSASVKGFLSRRNPKNADIVCARKLAARIPGLAPEIGNPGISRGHFHRAERKGWRGVGSASHRPPDRAVEGPGQAEFAAGGRFMHLFLPRASGGVGIVCGGWKSARQAMAARPPDHLRDRHS